MKLKQKVALKIFEKNKTWNDEHVLPGGKENPDKCFYVIRRSGSSIGLFSIFNTNLSRIRYAVENGMIPVIDMQNFRNNYLEEENVGKENAWEYFFEQPTDFSLEMAYQSKHIVLSASGIPKETPNDSISFLYNENGVLDEWRQICKKYIRLSPKIKEQINREIEKRILPNDRVLGVLARGTDYIRLKPSGHPVQPTPEQLIEKVREVMRMQNCNKVFVATEDKEIDAIFRKEFGTNYIATETEFVDYQGGYLSQNTVERKNDKFLRGVEYLTNIVMLTKCNCMVAGRTSGTVGACLLSEGWEYSYFFDLGSYD